MIIELKCFQITLETYKHTFGGVIMEAASSSLVSHYVSHYLKVWLLIGNSLETTVQKQVVRQSRSTFFSLILG